MLRNTTTVEPGDLHGPQDLELAGSRTRQDTRKRSQFQFLHRSAVSDTNYVARVGASCPVRRTEIGRYSFRYSMVSRVETYADISLASPAPSGLIPAIQSPQLLIDEIERNDKGYVRGQ